LPWRWPWPATASGASTAAAPGSDANDLADRSSHASPTQPVAQIQD
jgi:hypothetical protein